MNDQVRVAIQRPRTLRVFVPGWVIGDGSFPRAAVGEAVDVSLVLHSAGDTPSVCDETRTAIARPAYGRAPVTGPDGTNWRVSQIEECVKLFDSTEIDKAVSTPTSGYEREIVIVPFGSGLGLRKYVAPTPESKLNPVDP